VYDTPISPEGPGTIGPMPVPGKKLKDYIADALDGHAYTRWPQLEEITTTWRGSYGYLTAWLTATESIRLCRIQYLGDPDDWGFALYHASTQTYIDGRLPNGAFTGTPEQALDTALGLYLKDPTAWQIDPPKD
jgi:hypothetical protein